MGYSTDFDGELKFEKDLTGPLIAHLESILGEDVRDHPEWGMVDSFNHIDLEILEDYSGIRWNGTEKTRGMPDIIKFVIERMKIVMPDFGLIGELSAQGEDIEDRWVLLVNGDKVEVKEVVICGSRIICPHCEEVVIVEEAEDA